MITTCAPLRCTLVWLATTAVALLAAVALHADALALRNGPGPDLEAALVRGGSVVLLLCAAWAWLATTTVVVEAAVGRTGGALGVPASWRRLVLLACGATLAAGLAAPASTSADPGLAGLPLPDRAVGVPAPALVVPAPEAVTVARGDSLWTLAARDLGPTASPAEVQRRWRELYRLNRSVVGPDPDLIRPGQRLRLPPSSQEPS